MRLNVTAASGPAVVRTAEGGPEAKLRMVGRHHFELVPVHDVAFVAHAEDQREVLIGMRREMRLEHRAERSDACSRGDHHGIGRRMPQYEIAEGTLELNL